MSSKTDFYFLTRASWRDAWRDAAKVDLASHLKAPHWGTLQTSSISRLPRRSREPGSPTAELLQAGSSLQSRRDQATRPPRAPPSPSAAIYALGPRISAPGRKRSPHSLLRRRGPRPRGGKARTCSRDRTATTSRGLLEARTAHLRGGSQKGARTRCCGGSRIEFARR